MKMKFMNKEYEEFMKVLREMYKKEEDLNITYCSMISDSEYELEFFEDYGGGIKGLGAFTVSMEELHKRIQLFEIVPINYARSEYTSAIETAWTEKKTILIYPEDMDLIVVDISREEQGYLTKTHIVESQRYNTREEFENEIKLLLAA